MQSNGKSLGWRLEGMPTYVSLADCTCFGVDSFLMNWNGVILDRIDRIVFSPDKRKVAVLVPTKYKEPEPQSDDPTRKPVAFELRVRDCSSGKTILKRIYGKKGCSFSWIDSSNIEVNHRAYRL